MPTARLLAATTELGKDLLDVSGSSPQLRDSTAFQNAVIRSNQEWFERAQHLAAARAARAQDQPSLEEQCRIQRTLQRRAA
eukprot:4676193-Pyramimonas_sp.AAC.1